ncbi:hypothetical protein COLO4_19231 [Corchorus olitorius]|uniref:Uncharacterized protein n=1 Tax=Corchorus olitorius TaxID=93759 RepID=A0A1R3J681_9ROSI|nr:hypothetical protein COLO4_19231 [Corchorus olitorius]
MEDESIFLINKCSFDGHGTSFTSTPPGKELCTEVLQSNPSKPSYKYTLSSGVLNRFINDAFETVSFDTSVSNIECPSNGETINISLSSTDKGSSKDGLSPSSLRFMERKIGHKQEGCLDKTPISAQIERTVTEKEEDSFGPWMVVQTKKNKKENQKGKPLSNSLQRKPLANDSDVSKLSTEGTLSVERGSIEPATTKEMAFTGPLVDEPFCLQSSEERANNPSSDPFPERGIEEQYPNAHHSDEHSDGLGTKLDDSFQVRDESQCKSFPRLRRILETARGAGQEDAQVRCVLSTDTPASGIRVAPTLRSKRGKAKPVNKSKSKNRNVDDCLKL